MTARPYMPILKAKSGELTALSHYVVRRPTSMISPLIEVLPQELDENSNKKCSELEHIDKKIGELKKSLLIKDEPTINGIDFNLPTMELFIDNSFSDPNTLLENQIHPLEYLCHSISNERVTANPVVGYDRWFDEENATLYIRALKNISSQRTSKICLRIDKEVIDDEIKYEPEQFIENIKLILNTLQISKDQCTILLDFKDVQRETPDKLISIAKLVLPILSRLDFKNIYTTGGTAPVFISKAVKTENSSNIIPRIEMIMWKKITDLYPHMGFSDYGSRNPIPPDNVANKNVNSKILYTSDEVFYAVRGSSLKDLTKCDRSEKFVPLVEELMNSEYYTDCSGCWGDLEISRMALQPTADLTQWVSFSTNRHLCFVTDEVSEHQRYIAIRESTRKIESA